VRIVEDDNVPGLRRQHSVAAPRHRVAGQHQVIPGDGGRTFRPIRDKRDELAQRGKGKFISLNRAV
jgi:hypothetical protein